GLAAFLGEGLYGSPFLPKLSASRPRSIMLTLPSQLKSAFSFQLPLDGVVLKASASAPRSVRLTLLSPVTSPGGRVTLTSVALPSRASTGTTFCSHLSPLIARL